MIDNFRADKITCPYCGCQDSDSWEAGDEDENYQCGSCEKNFSMTREIDVSYTTYKKEDDCGHDPLTLVYSQGNGAFSCDDCGLFVSEIHHKERFNELKNSGIKFYQIGDTGDLR